MQTRLNKSPAEWRAGAPSFASDTQWQWPWLYVAPSSNGIHKNEKELRLSWTSIEKTLDLMISCLLLLVFPPSSFDPIGTVAD